MPDPGVRDDVFAPVFSPEINVNLPEDPKWDSTEWWKTIERLYPGWAQIIRSEPQMQTIISDFFAELDEDTFDFSTFSAQLMTQMKGTDWYTLQRESIRDSIVLEMDDPATYKANIAQNMKDIKQMMFEEGVSLQPAIINWMKVRAERMNYDKDELREFVVTTGRGGDKPTRGNAKRIFDDINGYAQSMLVPIDSGKAWDYSFDIAAGNDSMANPQDFIQGLASNTFDFVNVQELASKGITISDLLSDAKQQIATTLDLNSNDVRLYNMSLDDLVVGEGDSKRFINRQDAEAWAKKQGRYQMTDEHRGGVVNLANGIANHFGTRSFGGYV